MAIIICPNCNKSVSSTAEYCVHCGCALHTAQNIEEKNFKDLSSSEKDGLEKEFKALNPDLTEYSKELEFNTKIIGKYSRILQIMLIGGFILIGIISAVLAPRIDNVDSYLPIILFFISAGCYVGLVIFGLANFILAGRLKKRLIKNELIILTKFKVWLKENKNIEYETTGIKDKYVDVIRDFEFEGGVDKLELRR